MRIIKIKEIVAFRRKSDRSRISFVNNLKKERKPESDISGGGDYWISCLSAIGNVFKYGDKIFLDNKIDLLSKKIRHTKILRIKNQFQRNINILTIFGDFDFQKIKPEVELTFLRKPNDISILDINGLQIQVKPDLVFSYTINNDREIGAVWFIAQIEGFDKFELGMFTDALYRYLLNNHSKDFIINPHYCVAVDVYKGQSISYEEIKNKNIHSLLDETVKEVKKVL